MPRSTRNPLPRRSRAPLFAALGDDTRLALLTRLAGGKRHSISGLSAGSPLSRQAITKHLRVLEDAGLVHAVREGRESLFEFDPRPIQDASQYLDRISQHWDQALARLKTFVEN